MFDLWSWMYLLPLWENNIQKKRDDDFELILSTVDVDDLLKRAHAELAMELDSELESIYTPGSQDMSIVRKFSNFHNLIFKMMIHVLMFYSFFN